MRVRGPGIFQATTTSHHTAAAAPSPGGWRAAGGEQQHHRHAGVGVGGGSALTAANLEDPCLLVVQNKTREAITIRSESRTPRGQVFLDTLIADVEPGGVVALLACAANDLHVDCSNGLHKLSLQQNGELRLLPGLGFRQKMAPAGAALPAKFVLYADLEDLVPSHEHQHPSLADLLRSHPLCEGVRALATCLDALPAQFTVLAPRTLPLELAALAPEVLLRHLVIPVALFCADRASGAEHALDGALVQVQPLAGGHVVFAVEASAEAPAVRLHARLPPVRSAERFQLVYACD